MVYPMDKQQICFAFGGDIVKFVISLAKWLIKKLSEKKQPQFGKIEVVKSSIVFIIIHKD